MKRDTPIAAAAEMRRYLLGELPDAAAASIERAYFADAEFLARLELAEADLVDDYITGGLTPAEREKFERHYLSTEEHRAEVALARSLRAAGAGKERGWWRWAAAAAAVLVISGIAWRASRPPISSPPIEATRPTTAVSPAPSAKVQPPSTSDRSEPPESSVPGPPATVTVALRLSPDVTRGEGRPAMLVIPRNATHVELRFETAREPIESQRAQLAAVDGGVVWTGAVVSSRAPAARDWNARVTVPAAVLPPGDYLLSVSAPDGPDEFYFRVLPRRR